MAQDRSRSAFDARRPKHWSGLLAQQGRLLSDDDWNEADAIAQEDLRRTRADVIGPSGSPDSGFQVSSPTSTAAGIDFRLSPGTMYVGGLRTTLEAPGESFSLQKDWLQQSAADRSALGNTERIDFVYLEVWQQPVTAVEDVELTEVALGGPDTSVRVRTMRRVRVLPDVDTENCADAWSTLAARLGGLQPDNERTVDASLDVGYLPNNAPAIDLCSPATQSGYLGAENQAIRVEIGSDSSSLLWSYDNASPLYRVQVTNDPQGRQIIHFLTIPKDEAHWPLAQQVVELLPWSAALPNNEKVADLTGGFLSKVTASYDPNSQNIELASNVLASFGSNWKSRPDQAALSSTASSFFYLRVWNRGADVSSPAQIPFTVGQAVELKGTGLSVTLTGTRFRPGDFWIVAARPESPAKVVPWSLETGRLAEGVRRFYAPLAIIHWRPANGQHSFFDCRMTFDPLTSPAGCCVTVSPVPGWEHVIDGVAGQADLCLCFKPGTYTTTRPVLLRNARVQVHGAGAASRLIGNGIESVLIFQGCSSVDVHDLQIQTTGLVRPGAEGPKPHLMGSLSLINCDQVSLRNLRVRCASGPVKTASCITAWSAQRAASIRVQSCDLVVGANQIGLSIINFARSRVSDNTIAVDPTENAALPAAWLQDREFRRIYRRTLIWHHGVGKPPQGSSIRDFNLGQTAIWVDTAATLANAWPNVAAIRPFNPGRNVAMNARKFLYELAEDLVYANGSIGTRQFPAFIAYMAAMAALRTTASGVRTVAAQGLVIGGTTATEVHISGNTLRDTVQGIHVGVSTQRIRNPGTGAPVSDSAGRVIVAGNAIYLSLMPESVIERHGIFVGNCTSLLIEGNNVECERLGDAKRLAIDGIRVYGFIGRMAYVTRNDMIGVTTGVRFAALNNIADGASSMWRVTDNIAHAAARVVDPALTNGTTTHLVSSGNLA